MSGESVSSTSASSGQCFRQAPDIERALEGHGAANAKLESQLDEHVGLLLAAVEGMRDTTHARMATNRFAATRSWARLICTRTGRPWCTGEAQLLFEQPLLVSSGSSSVLNCSTNRSRPISPIATMAESCLACQHSAPHRAVPDRS